MEKSHQKDDTGPMQMLKTMWVLGTGEVDSPVVARNPRNWEKSNICFIEDECSRVVAQVPKKFLKVFGRTKIVHIHLMSV